jgi:predicted nuclease of restriction endonuclease-like (RecB) superfamily
MMGNIIVHQEYKEWLSNLKIRIQNSQIKAAISVNTELIQLYWDLGKMIVEKQKHSHWGGKLIEQLSKDLKAEFPELGGFSKSNLFYVRQFYLFYSQSNVFVEQPVRQLKNELVEQPVRQLKDDIIPMQDEDSQNVIVRQVIGLIPWGHNVIILKKIKDPKEALFYIHQTIGNNWSRSVLQMQIESNLYARQGKAITNFKVTLPKPQSDLANQLLKDPYNFNFLTLEKDVQELELEKQLVKNITQFLLELGKGFAYMGRQYFLKVGSKEYKLDLLFYHVRLKCYVVIELKTKEFEPEYIGKLNFYLSAIDAQVKANDDASTIGMLLCKTKDNLNVEFALRDVNKPIGVSEFTFNELPQLIQNAMPTVEELEQELFKDENDEQK